MYLILDSNLQRIGTLTIDGATQFTNDTITQQLADTDEQSQDGLTPSLSSGTDTLQNIDPNAQSKNYNHSGQITVMQGQPDSSKVIEGNCLAYNDLGRWYIMKIYKTDESVNAAGQHLTIAYLVNLFIFDLARRIPTANTISVANAKQAFGWLLQNVNWTLDWQATTNWTASFSTDGKTQASSAFETALQTYNLECDAYVKIGDDGTIYSQVIEITDNLNGDLSTAQIRLGNNLTAYTRTKVASAITKLYIYGSNGGSISSVNNGKNYLVDDDANHDYNSEWQNGTYLEGVITANSINEPSGLLIWGRKILSIYNHDRYYYSVTTTHDFNPKLGQQVHVIDLAAVPQMTVEANVISRTISQADKSANSVSFGEFVTVIAVTPAWLTSVTNKLTSAVQAAKNDASTISPVMLTPDGTDFSDNGDKRAILQAWESNTNFSSYVDPKGFVWHRYNKDGTLDNSYSATGYLNNINQVGTYKGYIQSDYIQDASERNFDQQDATLLGTFKPKVAGATHTPQFIVKLSDGSYLSSHALDTGSNGNDLLFAHWDSNWNQLDTMTIQDGGHGASFGIEYIGSTPNIWGVTKDFTSSDKRYRVSRVAYQAGKTLAYNDSSISNFLFFGSDDYIRVNYDNANKLVGITRQNGDYNIVKESDCINGTLNVIYGINFFNYGFDANSQTFQASELSFPYVYWHSGDIDMADERTIYCVNVIHQGQVFQSHYDFNYAFKTDNDVREPEALSFLDSTHLLVSFNEKNTQAMDTTEYHWVYSVPLVIRPDAAKIQNGVIME